MRTKLKLDNVIIIKVRICRDVNNVRFKVKTCQT
jgi:hypothetical protein